MALTGPDFWKPERGGVMVTAVGTECFFCGNAIEADPAWVWSGATAEAFMHLACAVELGVRLFSDVHQWQRTTGQRFRVRS